VYEGPSARHADGPFFVCPSGVVAVRGSYDLWVIIAWVGRKGKRFQFWIGELEIRIRNYLRLIPIYGNVG
jgi:hypothetical protein